jgi:hypothetical protein
MIPGFHTLGPLRRWRSLLRSALPGLEQDVDEGVQSTVKRALQQSQAWLRVHAHTSCESLRVSVVP